LWNELTAEEHLEIFADLKGVPRKLRAAVIRDKLESVGLYGVRDKKVRVCFSPYPSSASACLLI
jgi:ABC-type multidrug transport system ATPase subunit